MTATDEIRSLLDKRGVEWFESVTRKGLTWIYRDGKAIRFHPWQPDTLKVSMFDLTPEQAIEATLGRGECRALSFEGGFCNCDAGEYEEFWEPACKCSACGELIPMRNYCPNCGRKLVKE